MTINKNERSYIKQFGRVAMSSRQPQLDEVQDDTGYGIGQIETNWSELGSCWIFTGVVFHGEEVDFVASRLDHNTWEDALKWIELKGLEYNRHRSFGAYVVYMLSDMSMSKTQLGHHIKVSRQSIYDWINNKSLPDVPNYLALARLYAKWMSQDINTTLVDMSESIQ